MWKKNIKFINAWWWHNFFLKNPKQPAPTRLSRLGLKWIALKCTSQFGQSKWTYIVHNTLEFLVPQATHTMMQSDNFKENQ